MAGNVTGNYFIGNGSQLTNLPSTDWANIGNITNANGPQNIAIGENVHQTFTYTPGFGTVAIGYAAGQTNQGGLTVAVGWQAGQSNQSNNAIAIGYAAGATGQEDGAVAIGAFAGSKAGKVVGEYGGKAINAAGDFFGGIGDKVKGAYGDAKETLAQTKNAVGDAAYTVGATAGANIERYTGVGRAIDKATYNAKGFLGINTESKVEDLGNGARKTVNPDGSFTIGDGGGTKEYDAKGELLKKTSPMFMGSSTETDVKTGDVTSKYSAGPMELAKTKFAAGGSQSTGSYDLGAAVVKTRKTLTAKQQAEADLASGITPKETVDGKPAVIAADANNAGNMVAKTSTENADMGREAGKGGANNTVVSNNVSSNNTTKIVPMKTNPRPEYTGSSLDRYTNRITVY